MKCYKFVRSYQVKDEEARLYKKGEVVELSEASAQHFQRKNLITEVRAKKKVRTPRLIGKRDPEIIAPIIVTQKAKTGATA